MLTLSLLLQCHRFMELLRHLTRKYHKKMQVDKEFSNDRITTEFSNYKNLKKLPDHDTSNLPSTQNKNTRNNKNVS